MLGGVDWCAWVGGMKQLTLATAGFERYAKTTRRAVFLAEMEGVLPWSALCALIEPFYPKPGNGRPPVGVERMLRIYFLQHWFNLSDPAVEEALYDSQAMRRFVGIDLGREPVPGETTVCRFRHLLEEHDLGRRLFDEVQRHLAAKGLKVATGTIVDATIINAPSSTKNADKARDPEKHQTKKGNQSQRPNTEVRLTHRWRDPDSNYRFRGSDRDQRSQWNCDLKSDIQDRIFAVRLHRIGPAYIPPSSAELHEAAAPNPPSALRRRVSLTRYRTPDKARRRLARNLAQSPRASLQAAAGEISSASYRRLETAYTPC